MTDAPKVTPEVEEQVRQIREALMPRLTSFIGQPTSPEVMQRMADALCENVKVCGGKMELISIGPATWENLHPVWWKRIFYRCVLPVYRMVGKRPRFSVSLPDMIVMHTEVQLPRLDLSKPIDFKLSV